MGFFNLHKPLQYKYRYIYYDPKKEALKEREKAMKDVEQPLEAENTGFKTSIQRGTFREMANRRGDRRTADKQSNIRLIVIIIALLAVMYFLLK